MAITGLYDIRRKCIIFVTIILLSTTKSLNNKTIINKAATVTPLRTVNIVLPFIGIWTDFQKINCTIQFYRRTECSTTLKTICFSRLYKYDYYWETSFLLTRIAYLLLLNYVIKPEVFYSDKYHHPVCHC
jgi:hypothetical protein